MLESDLRRLGRADDKLRSGASAARAGRRRRSHVALHRGARGAPRAGRGGPGRAAAARAVRRHAGHSSRFIGMADREMRAYMGELHDAASPPCITLGQMMRGVYGRLRQPHAALLRDGDHPARARSRRRQRAGDAAGDVVRCCPTPSCAAASPPPGRSSTIRRCRPASRASRAGAVAYGSFEKSSRTPALRAERSPTARLRKVAAHPRFARERSPATSSRRLRRTRTLRRRPRSGRTAARRPSAATGLRRRRTGAPGWRPTRRTARAG